MRKDERKAAVAAYRERKIASGIYSVRCLPNGLLWAGSAPDISTVENRLWFTLRQGGSTSKSLQAAWSEHEPENFVFEEVDRFDQEPDAHIRHRILKDALALWCARLGAEPI